MTIELKHIYHAETDGAWWCPECKAWWEIEYLSKKEKKIRVWDNEEGTTKSQRTEIEKSIPICPRHNCELEERKHLCQYCGESFPNLILYKKLKICRNCREILKKKRSENR